MASDQAAMETIHEQIATLTATVTTQLNQIKQRFDQQDKYIGEIGDRLASLET